MNAFRQRFIKTEKWPVEFCDLYGDLIEDREISDYAIFVLILKSQFASKLYGVILYGSKARGEATPDVLLLPHVFSWELWQETADSPFFFFHEVFRDGWPVYGDPAVFAPLARKDVPPLYEETAVTA